MRAASVVAGLCVLTALGIGLLQSRPQAAPDPAADARPQAGDPRPATAPPPPARGALADLRRRGGELVDATPADLRAELRRLRGTPVVVNAWGSWCGPCRDEFPVLRGVAERTRDRVAFLGIDVLDRRADAERFLRTEPTSWPHLFDPRQDLLRALGTGTGAMPLTAFVDRRGRVASVRYGPYRDEDVLLQDLRERLGVTVAR